METPRPSILGIFCNHPVAANLLMVMMTLAGIWGLNQLNTQFFPSFNIDYATVRTTWSGASAGDVEELITIPLEQELREVDFVKQITSVSKEGAATVSLEFTEGTDMGLAVAQVKERVDALRDLPQDADAPEVSQVTPYEGIASFLVTGGAISELRVLVKRFEADLLARGIAKVNIRGLPQQQIAIEIPTRELRRLNLSLDDIGRRVAAWSQDAPVGIVGRGETSRQLRFRERRKDELAFESIALVSDANGRRISLGDIATIERKPKAEQVSIQHQGKPAVEVALLRTENSDSLQAAQIFREWLDDTRPTLPAGVSVIPFNQSWELIQDRINLLVKNGLGGLVLVVLILFLFLSVRVAWWTAVGIPVSFMATLAVFYLIGGSLNMISLFGMIMALGIIVDDAIVVGEQAMTEHQEGTRPRLASEYAARQMLGPVFSSSLTTIAAFMPLLLVGGIIGTIMQAIPVVVMCVIVASLIECFLILPGHLTHSFRKMGNYQPGAIRRRLDIAFETFRDNWFRPFARGAIENRWSTLAATFALLIITIGWVAGGRISFQFFPSAEADRVFANVGFVAGTPKETVQEYLSEMEQALYRAEHDIGEKIIKLVVIQHGATAGDDDIDGDSGGRGGDQFGGIRAELLDPDQRRTRNRELIRAWQKQVPRRAGIERFTITEPRAGPPGKDLDIRVTGANIAQVKLAAQNLQNALRAIDGIGGIGDNTPYGREQMILQLTPTATALGLQVENVARQLRAAFDGYKVHELSDGYDDIEVRVLLPRTERDAIADLAALPIVLPSGGLAPISNLATIRRERGFETLRHTDGQLAVTVTADVDPAVANANRIRANLETNVLPQLANENGVDFSFEGRQADQAETLGDMQLGMMLALLLIYLVLAWVFASYGWPLLVMLVIPFGIVGAIWGHVAMGQDVTLLSLFGFFALSGIVVNDSIILVVRYRKLREEGMPPTKAVVEASCQRLRAVLLTSLTTVGGLTPLLFETSLQAQFLIPMATTLAFGLAFATFLVLIVIPSMLLIYENGSAHVADWKAARTNSSPQRRAPATKARAKQ